MAKEDNLVRLPVRLNIKIPQHAKINAVLVRLDKEICKSKAQFIIDALEYYIDHFGEDRFTAHDGDSDLKYVTRKDFDELERKVSRIAESVAKDEVIKQFGSLLTEMAGNSRSVPEGIKTQPETAETEDTGEAAEDTVMSELVSSWM